MNWHDPFRRCPKSKPKPKPWRNPRKHPSKNRWPLMPRQALILHLYNVGLETHEVAEIVQIEVNTLHKHLDRIYYKFNVHDRGAAIRKAMSHNCKLKSGH